MWGKSGRFSDFFCPKKIPENGFWVFFMNFHFLEFWVFLGCAQKKPVIVISFLVGKDENKSIKKFYRVLSRRQELKSAVIKFNTCAYLELKWIAAYTRYGF